MSLRLLHYSDLETALDDPRQCARVAGTIAARRDGDTVVVGTGDNTAPGALPLATEGRVALDFFAAVDPDADTFGNHDFDFGIETARELAAGAPQPWLVANARLNGSRFAPDVTDTSTVVDTDGYSVGIVGVAHPATDEINPAATALSFTDPVAAVREEAAALREQGVDFVIVASHCGTRDERIARETDVDAVLGGHVHDVHVETVDGTFVVRPGRAGRYVSEVTLGPTADVTIHEIDGRHADAALADTIEKRRAAHGLDEVVAAVPDPIERTENAVRVAESRIGNFVTDALRWAAEADVAIAPVGAIRSGEPLAGPVTTGDLVGIMPYEDDLVVLALPGDRLEEALAEVPLGYHFDGPPNRLCSHVSGARLVWNDRTGEFQSVTIDGDPIDPDRQYSLAVAEYLVETSHVSSAFDGSDVVERCGLAHDAIVEYAREVGIDPELEGRIERPQLRE